MGWGSGRRRKEALLPSGGAQEDPLKEPEPTFRRQQEVGTRRDGGDRRAGMRGGGMSSSQEREGGREIDGVRDVRSGVTGVN